MNNLRPHDEHPRMLHYHLTTIVASDHNRTKSLPKTEIYTLTNTKRCSSANPRSGDVLSVGFALCDSKDVTWRVGEVRLKLRGILTAIVNRGEEGAVWTRTGQRREAGRVR